MAQKKLIYTYNIHHKKKREFGTNETKGILF